MPVWEIPEYVRKYGIVAMLVALVPLAVPYIDKYLESTQEAKVSALGYKVKKEIVDEIKIAINQQTAEVRLAHGRKNLTEKEALYLMRTAVGYQSIYKVDWLKKFLSPYTPQDAQLAQSRIRVAIRAELIRQSNIYIEELNTFQHPKLGRLGQFIAESFSMDTFLEGLYLIVESNSCLNCDQLYDNIMYYMLDAQNDLWQVAERRMK